MTRAKLLLAVFLLSLSSLAMAGGGGGKGSAPPPPPPPPEPMAPPAATKAPEPSTFKRKNKQSGAMGTGGTMLTETDATQAETGVNLGGNTLLGS